MYISIETFIVYSISAILASLIWAITGFGSAIMLLLLYQLADFTPLMESTTLKYTLVLHCVCLVPNMAFMLLTHFNEFRKTFYWRLVIPLIIGEAGLVYLGQYVQKHTETDIIRIIIGILVLIVAFLKILKICIDKYKKKNDSEVQENSDGNNEEENETYQEPPYLILWALFIGILAGFLGGLLGAKGPPLITFFLIFPTPKGIIRTTGMATTTVNLIGRIISYAVTKPPELDDYWSRHGLEFSILVCVSRLAFVCNDGLLFIGWVFDRFENT